MSCEVKRNSSILSKLVLINHSRENTDSLSIKTSITKLLSYEKEIKELSGKKCRENSEMCQAVKK